MLPIRNNLHAFTIFIRFDGNALQYTVVWKWKSWKWPFFLISFSRLVFECIRSNKRFMVWKNVGSENFPFFVRGGMSKMGWWIFFLFIFTIILCRGVLFFCVCPFSLIFSTLSGSYRKVLCECTNNIKYSSWLFLILMGQFMCVPQDIHKISKAKELEWCFVWMWGCRMKMGTKNYFWQSGLHEYTTEREFHNPFTG